MKRTSLFFALAASLVLGACGGDNGTGPGTGGDGNGAGSTYSATVSGDVTASFSGKAVFGSAKDEQGNTAFVIVGGIDSTSKNGFAFIRENMERPSNGTYTIVASDSNATADQFQAIAFARNDSLLIASNGGTLQITSSSDSKVAGSFQFDGTAVDVAAPSDEKTVVVKGTFTATKAIGSVGSTLNVTSLRISPR